MRFDLRAGLAVSPDGKYVAYTTAQGFVLRPRDRLATRLLQGISGGAPTPIGDVGWASGDWTAEGIVLAGVRGLFRIPPEGGPAEPIVIEFDEGEQVTAPEILPRRPCRAYTVIPTRSILTPGVANVAGARIEVIDLQTHARKVVIRGGPLPLLPETLALHVPLTCHAPAPAPISTHTRSASMPVTRT